MASRSALRAFSPITTSLRATRSFQTSSRLLAETASPLPAKKPVGAFRGGWVVFILTLRGGKEMRGLGWRGGLGLWYFWAGRGSGWAVPLSCRRERVDLHMHNSMALRLWSYERDLTTQLAVITQAIANVLITGWLDSHWVASSLAAASTIMFSRNTKLATSYWRKISM